MVEAHLFFVLRELTTLVPSNKVFCADCCALCADETCSNISPPDIHSFEVFALNMVYEQHAVLPM